jgi:pyruvate,water dikinase
MLPIILPLSDLEATLETVGGKGMSLAKLTRAGLPVPSGFHITTEAYRHFVSENGLQPRILKALKEVEASDPAALEPVACQIGEFFAKGLIPTEIAQAISKAYAELCKNQPVMENKKAVAVRSSATAEDLPGASFAGQQETYLNVRGELAVLEAVKKCWASLWTVRAMAYRARQNITPNDVALAVVVQELVFAEAAGVLFTANPVNGRRDELMITAAWGLGEAIVSGAVTPDTITVNKSTGRPVRRETAEKLVMTVRTDSGTCEQPVPDRLKKAPVLSYARVRELTRLGMEIEQLYAAPIDIEWALAGGKFAIVQARPVTALPASPTEGKEPRLDWTSPNPKAILMRMSFAEFVPDPVSPLFATLALPIAQKASLELMGEYLGIDDPNRYPFSVVNGYVYVGMVLDLKMYWAMAARLMGGVVQKMLKTSQARWMVIGEKYHDVVEQWQKKELASLSPAELLKEAKEIFACTAEYYTVAQSGPIPAASSSELSFSRFYNVLVKRKRDPDASIFLLGLDNLPLRAEKSLFDLAQWIKAQPGLAGEAMQAPVKEICVKLQTRLPLDDQAPAWAEFSSRFDAHLAEYGHTVYDLDFAKPVPADDPAPLVEALKSYLDGTVGNPYERQTAALERREQMTQAVVKRLDPLRRKWFQKLLKWAQDCAPKREDCIGDLGWGYPWLRKVFAELGRRLSLGGAILSPEDIYWLEAQELDALVVVLAHGGILSSYAGQVEKHKIAWQRARNTTPPMVLPEKSFAARLMMHDNQAGDTLKGIGASSGRVTARACVLRDPKDFSRMQLGDVIVAVITTPAWTPLFVRASAIVTDIGGPLSHSSIVAREYGIPAVLGTGIATRRIRDGQMVTVDGNAGTVSLK